ncbi:secretion protein HlyD [Bacteroides helcogenes]|uniref:KWG Leptospira repeat protein n=1 Tax=Bacteroides helcogenes (strain ATCC 35417 / DSM 20613 / JCM 6297 / CCUG 15421 / P 36-108) TaxID=693979 RepID=E6STU3_BACT6|nr:secretion protein HlyD [Bacteroides helcogenes]ADV42296.1 hypothetical protein Bache_0266 [Bacteroides helcogenes P 36-108]MDY5237250.1 hypothetical protein [Bacteroides helcogenes]
MYRCTILLKTLLLSALFGVPTAAVHAQLRVVDVSTLSEKGNYEREGVVTEETANDEEFVSLLMQLRQHANKTLATEAQDMHKNNSSNLDASLQKLEEVRKMGAISEADYQKAIAQFNKAKADMAKADETVGQQASGKGISDPAALKERIRQYCVGKRFYRHVCPEVKGVRRVDVGSLNGGPIPRYRGFINSLGEIMVEPDRYSNFNSGVAGITWNRDNASMCFSIDDKAIAHIWNGKDEYRSACMIDNKGRVLLSGDYLWLSFFRDCCLLKAEKTQGKFGIIDYDGNVLEPFIHSGPNAEEMYKAKDRIMKEKGWTPIQLF